MGAMAVMMMMMSGSGWIEHGIGTPVRELGPCRPWARTSRAARPSRWVDELRPSGTCRHVLLGDVSPWAGQLQSRGASPVP